MSRDVLRIVDANLNRIREGLRFLDDVARFALNDAALSGAFRALRHEVHLTPVGKPAPPRPRSPDWDTSPMTCSGVMVASAFTSAV